MCVDEWDLGRFSNLQKVELILKFPESDEIYPQALLEETLHALPKNGPIKDLSIAIETYGTPSNNSCSWRPSLNSSIISKIDGLLELRSFKYSRILTLDARHNFSALSEWSSLVKYIVALYDHDLVQQLPDILPNPNEYAVRPNRDRVKRAAEQAQKILLESFNEDWISDKGKVLASDIVIEILLEDVGRLREATFQKTEDLE